MRCLLFHFLLSEISDDLVNISNTNFKYKNITLCVNGGCRASCAWVKGHKVSEHYSLHVTSSRDMTIIIAVTQVKKLITLQCQTQNTQIVKKNCLVSSTYFCTCHLDMLRIIFMVLMEFWVPGTPAFQCGTMKSWEWAWE